MNFLEKVLRDNDKNKNKKQIFIVETTRHSFQNYGNLWEAASYLKKHSESSQKGERKGEQVVNKQFQNFEEDNEKTNIVFKTNDSKLQKNKLIEEKKCKLKEYVKNINISNYRIENSKKDSQKCNDYNLIEEL